MSEQRCPDCNSRLGGMGMIAGGWYGDGKCSHCEGTGKAKGIYALGEDLFGEVSDCMFCGGSGTCQTCGGEGSIEE